MPTTAPRHAGFKRPRAQMKTLPVLYDHPSAAADQQSEDAGALVPFVPSREEPLHAVPLSAIAPKKLPSEVAGAMVLFVPSPPRSFQEDAASLSAVAPKKKKLAAEVVRAEPPWLRTGLLRYLGYRIDLPVRFIDEKVVTATDLVPHQNRFRLPREGVIRNLWPFLSPLQRNAANMLHEEAPRPPKVPKLPKQPAGARSTGGFPCSWSCPTGGHVGIRELQLARWDSSGGTVIKGEGYLNFINSCGFKVDDVVEIWAFKETYFRLFGEDVCHDSPLYLLLTKKDQMLPR
ncbi:unnamed protein product [Alopecurus aequalis]